MSGPTASASSSAGTAIATPTAAAGAGAAAGTASAPSAGPAEAPKPRRIKRDAGSSASGTRPIRFRTNFDNVIYDVLRTRPGWVETESDSDWDFMWNERDIVFETFDTQHLDAHQRMNHYRNCRELCRKDLLAKNIKRMRRLLEKEGRGEESPYDFTPVTFVLPGDYALFVEEFKRSTAAAPTAALPAAPPAATAAAPGLPAAAAATAATAVAWAGSGTGSGAAAPSTSSVPSAAATAVSTIPSAAAGLVLWIMKPIARSQGKGIFLFTKLSQIQEWRSEYRWRPENAAVEAYVVQRYLANPYLIGGKKFDLRVYCLVTSYNPLTVWVYRSGFTRFSASRYSTDSSDIVNTYVHLTNVAVQKTSTDYNADFGGKWEIGRLKQYMASRHGMAAADRLFADIQQIMLRSLLAVQKALINDPHCFELYGYDILIDDALKPWLLEVNASPSMTASTRDDYDLKYKLLNDTLDVVDMEGRLRGDEIRIGGFDLVWKGDGPLESARCGTVYSCMMGADFDRHVNVWGPSPGGGAPPIPPPSVVSAARAVGAAAGSGGGSSGGGVGGRGGGGPPARGSGGGGRAASRLPSSSASLAATATSSSAAAAAAAAPSGGGIGGASGASPSAYSAASAASGTVATPAAPSPLTRGASVSGAAAMVARVSPALPAGGGPIAPTHGLTPTLPPRSQSSLGGISGGGGGSGSSSGGIASGGGVIPLAGLSRLPIAVTGPVAITGTAARSAGSGGGVASGGGAGLRPRSSSASRPPLPVSTSLVLGTYHPSIAASTAAADSGRTSASTLHGGSGASAGGVGSSTPHSAGGISQYSAGTGGSSTLPPPHRRSSSFQNVHGAGGSGSGGGTATGATSASSGATTVSHGIAAAMSGVVRSQIAAASASGPIAGPASDSGGSTRRPSTAGPASGTSSRQRSGSGARLGAAVAGGSDSSRSHDDGSSSAEPPHVPRDVTAGAGDGGMPCGGSSGGGARDRGLLTPVSGASATTVASALVAAGSGAVLGSPTGTSRVGGSAAGSGLLPRVTSSSGGGGGRR